MTLEAMEFIGRFAMYILPKGFCEDTALWFYKDIPVGFVTIIYHLQQSKKISEPSY